MSRFTTEQGKQPGVAGIAAGFKSAIADQGDEFISPEAGNSVVSIESHKEISSDAAAHFTDVKGAVVGVLEEAEISVEQADVRVEAASIAAMGLGDADGYFAKATQEAVSVEGMNLVADADGVDLHAGLESFDQSSIGDHREHTLAFNFEAVRQDVFGEALFPTIVQTPEAGAIDVRVEQTVVHKEVKRAISGDVTDFGKNKVLDAYSDHTILASEHTRIYPVKLESGDNAKYFVDEAVIGAQVIEVDGADVRTAPLKPGVESDLLALSQAAPANGGQRLTDEDALDARIGLKNIYIKIDDATDAGNVKTSIVAMKVKDLPKSTFFKGPEQNTDRELTLAFNNETLGVDAKTQSIAKVDAAALAVLGDRRMNISVKMSGTVDLETGALNVFGAAPTIGGLYLADGTKASLASGDGKAIADALSFEVVGYDVDAMHANSNMRYRGLIGSYVGKTERYAIGFQPPITAKAPVNEAEKRHAGDLKTITAISRARTANNAVTKLLERADMLKAFAEAVKSGMPTPEVEGAGRHLVKPWYREIELDLLQVVDSNKTHQKAADIKAAIVNAIRSLVYPMAQESNYQTVLEAITNGNETVPRLVIATDSVLQQHIMVDGDDRTAIGFDHKVVVSPDTRIENQIFLTFVRKIAKSEPDAMSFGAHGWIPEMVASASISQGGSTAKVTSVQPRSRHFCLCPVLAKITVKNLDKALESKLSS